MLWIILVAIVGLFAWSTYQSKQRKKQELKEQNKRSRICAGTKIITIGGIMGVVVSIDHENRTFVLETNGTLIEFDMRAIYQYTLPPEVEAQIAAEAAAQAAAQEAAKNAKKNGKKADAPKPEVKEEKAEEKAE